MVDSNTGESITVHIIGGGPQYSFRKPLRLSWRRMHGWALCPCFAFAAPFQIPCFFTLGHGDNFTENSNSLFLSSCNIWNVAFCFPRIETFSSIKIGLPVPNAFAAPFPFRIIRAAFRQKRER